MKPNEYPIRRHTIIALLCSFALLLGCICLPAYAEAASTASGVTIKAVIPENQVDKSKTYYDLRLEPGQKQTVQLAVRNGSQETITASVSICTASTGRNGLIQYTVPDVRDESLSLPITDITKVMTPQVTLPAASEALIDIEINMPSEGFDGCLLGGVVVTAEPESPSEEGKQGNLQINNNYVYAVGLKLTQNDTAVKPEMHLRAISPGLVNYRPVVTVNLQNSEAAIIKGMSITGQVYKKDMTEAFKLVDMPEVDMAPNSNFDLGIDWNDQPLESGVYRLRMRAEYEEQVWEWDEEFVIEQSASDRVNEESVYIEPVRPIWLYIVVGAVILAAVFMLAFLLGKRRERGKAGGEPV